MKVMLCNDPKKLNKAALSLAIDYSKRFGAALHIVSCIVGGIEDSRMQIENAKHQLASAAEAAKKEAVTCSTHLMTEVFSPGDHLIRFAREEEMNLIVLGIEKISKVEKLIFGSTAQFVILKADCPVLTIKLDS